jgi:hypothetical protein
MGNERDVMYVFFTVSKSYQTRYPTPNCECNSNEVSDRQRNLQNSYQKTYYEAEGNYNRRNRIDESPTRDIRPRSQEYVESKSLAKSVDGKNTKDVSKRVKDNIRIMSSYVSC